MGGVRIKTFSSALILPPTQDEGIPYLNHLVTDIDKLTTHEEHKVKDNITVCSECWQNEKIHASAERVLRSIYNNKEDGIGNILKEARKKGKLSEETFNEIKEAGILKIISRDRSWGVHGHGQDKEKIDAEHRFDGRVIGAYRRLVTCIELDIIRPRGFMQSTMDGRASINNSGEKNI